MPRGRPGEHIIRARDGWPLSVLDVGPARGAEAVVIAGHAMMVDRRTVYRGDRPSLGRTLADAGLRVLVPDLRGHGNSGPGPRDGGDWSYDELVEDVGEYIRLARELEPELPLVLIGHSLFGHNALAYLGQHPDSPVDGIVAVAADLWQRRFEPSAVHWLAKVLVFQLTAALCGVVGYLPARAVGFGTADEPRGYWTHFGRLRREGGWFSGTGVDYQSGLLRIRCPSLVVVSEGDRLFARPESALRFAENLRHEREVTRLPDAAGPEALRNFAPDHMGMLTDPRSEPLWDSMARWIRGIVEHG